ncbi:snoRNA-binding rRNA-processing protein [Lobosporangium transversale]|uniref:Bystin-domain-containing protein n=1 Tax=Lobosporangium transversale TaxID=64571 RepID=A0A1Y2G767_9FUNG|nr:Bystin-domain-containing protein [Lobosporangium transversale]KAF9919391.1 snoRNA-binding rRNA-processing protein [Lobosporangium transversale]ORY96080.1 Bystin-domain-containing protein [Lobosporangium transversale]|eukprot:XP_021875507.1 Bystin-domain-containing protein [Lobosporangium transversale]
MGKEQFSRSSTRAPRHDPLHVQLMGPSDNDPLGKQPRAKAARNERKNRPDANFVDAKLSRKILSIAQEQQDEIRREERGGLSSDEEEGSTFGKKSGSGPTRNLIPAIGDSDEDESDIEDGDDFGTYDEIEIDQQDAELLAKFMPAAPKEKKTLADLIMEKINAQNAANAAAAAAASSDMTVLGSENKKGPLDTAMDYADDDDATTSADRPMPMGLSPKVIEVYSKVGLLLSRYKSGKLPKAFKIIPSLQNWEEILYITAPENWTVHATYQATRIFTSNLKEKQAHKFFSLVLLDKIRDDIAENKKLNYHLYMALKKSLYKSKAFFKGILFPLCESGNCTLKEAAIVGSVITKVSIPVLHSAAALLRLADMEYTGPNSLFIRVLLDKKYALPYKVIDALVDHFLRFKMDPRIMPVLWHQSFLIFAQRYKSDITPDQKQALVELLRFKTHEGISPEIRRELMNSVARGEMLPEPTDDMLMDI